MCGMKSRHRCWFWVELLHMVGNISPEAEDNTHVSLARLWSRVHG